MEPLMQSVSLSHKGILVSISEFTKEIDISGPEPEYIEAITKDELIRALTFIPKNDFIRQQLKVYGTPMMHINLVKKMGVSIATFSEDKVLIPLRADIFLKDSRKTSSAASPKLQANVLRRLQIATDCASPYIIPKMNKIKNAEFTGTLRDYQEDVITQIEKYVSEINTKPHGCIISIPCGGGKTVIAIATIARFGRKTIWVTPKEFLESQLVSSVEIFAPNMKVSKFPDISGDIVTIIVNTAALCRPETLETIRKARFGLCVIDETHRIGTQMFSRSLFACSADIVIGLSATPDRQDGGRSVIESIVGPVIVSMDRKDSQGSFDVTVQLRYLDYKSPVESIYMDSGTVSFTMTHTAVSEIPERVSDIISVINQLLEEGHKIIVFSRIKSVLKSIQEIMGTEKTGMYVGGSKSKKHKEQLANAEKAPVILSTCSMGSEGLDVPGITAVILETPRKDVRQMVGRILRIQDGKRRIIIDYRDIVSSPVFSKSERARDSFYVSENYEVYHETVKIDNAPSRDLSKIPDDQKTMMEFFKD